MVYSSSLSVHWAGSEESLRRGQGWQPELDAGSVLVVGGIRKKAAETVASWRG